MTIDRELMNYAPLFFPVFWVFISLLLSRLSGWSALADVYSSDEPFEGQQQRFVNARMRWMIGYNRALVVGASSRGLYLAMFILLRPGHAPLFIPWRDISTRSVRNAFRDYTEFRFTKVPEVYIRLPENIAEKVLAHKVSE